MFIEPAVYEMPISFEPEEVEGIYDTYQSDIDNRSVFAFGDVASYSSDVPGLSSIMLGGDYIEYSGSIDVVTGYLQTDGYQEVAYVNENTATRFYGAGQRNHAFLGCRISSPGINIPSDDTYDGGPVVEVWATSPLQATNQVNPNGLINL